MDKVAIATSILSLVAGVGVFLIACTMMSSSLEALGSRKLKALFSKTAKNKLVGVGIGTVTTAVIQSSSATSVMVIGFVSAGVMTLTQAATIIFGANIGTTVTGQLVALGMFGNGISTSVIFGALAGVGAFVLAFVKKDKLKNIGGILAGFGMLFAGLTMMGDAMEFFSEMDSVKDFLASFKNPWLLILIGTILTALIQSSSVMTSMVITMVVSGLITLKQGVYITMGANIGTCITALLAGITGTRDAKRTALIHVFFNVCGVIMFMIADLFLGLGNLSYGSLLQKAFPDAPQLQMAMFHTIFNVATVIVILPFTNLLVKAVTKILPDKPEEKQEIHFKYLDEHLLATPSIATMEVKNEILNMAEISLENFNIACESIRLKNFKDKEKFEKNEKMLNFVNKGINSFVVKLLNTELNERDRAYLSSSLRTASDLEIVGDYAVSMTEYLEKLIEIGCMFSSSAINEILALNEIVNELYENVLKTYRDGDRNTLKKVFELEENIDDLSEKMAENHIRRLEKNECTPEVGARFLSLSSDIERIADHYVNVAKSIKSFS